MKNRSISPYKIAFTYIGAVIGAGFASGQEIFQFFAVFGSNGILGLLLTTILYILFGYIIMDLGFKLQCTSHIEIINFSTGKIFGRLVDAIITFFLFGTIVSMLAGSGALVKQQFGISSQWGSIAMALLTLITLLAGMEGLINSMSLLVPFLLVSIFGISILSIVNNTFPLSAIDFYSPPNSLIGHWALAAILYISFNTIISIAVLGPLGAQAEDKDSIKKGAIFGGLGLGLCALAITLALWGVIAEGINMEIPMLYVAEKISPKIQGLYSIMLFIGIYTTAVSSAFGFIGRIVDIHNKKAKFLSFAVMFFTFLLSNIGFSNLVKYLYPIEGYAGLVLLISLLWGKLKMMLMNN
ncbi:hypothetical protein NSA47_12360 [Irregularibacter muris]|uniref:Membrane protein YkvI n=1 Tax=Irregularibacter muris TaxID=1796619 RepID=A0AAE3HGJ7_9FIRM|nr:hypothetical protein [Irregularibacter muris]MCR1899771.1 hypothetical protein [Irregularibacter muris]